MTQDQWVSPGGFRWIDLSNPSETGLRQLAKQLELPRSVVRDCLQPDHLPKVERLGSATFVILRAYDEKAPLESDTVQELTRKIAIFKTDRFILTVHRKDQPFLADLRQKVKEHGVDGCAESEATIGASLLLELMRTVLLTFELPLDGDLVSLDSHEARIFGVDGDGRYSLQEGYILRRRGGVFRRVLRLSSDVLTRVSVFTDISAGGVQNVRETTERLAFKADDLLDSASTLLNLHFSISSQNLNQASHHTNEVVRLLTVFSVFFLPLNFIAGIYGMNFEFIPGLDWKYGFPISLVGMGVVCIGIYLWIKNYYFN